MQENFLRIVWTNAGLLGVGLGVTLQVCVLALAFALVVGLAACLLRLYVPWARPFAFAYIEFCRATPMVVQLLWVNYVWPELFGFPTTVEGAGVLALGLQSSGYLAETFRAGIEGVSRGHREAAAALGITPAAAMRRIVLPQVLLDMAPSLVNQLAVILKSSTLVSVIAVPDLMFQAQRLVDRTLEPIEILTTVALVYIVLIFSVSHAAKALAMYFRRKFGLAHSLSP